GATCDTGNCVDGICCDQPVCGLCQACNVPGSEGLCSTVTNTQDDTCNGVHACDAQGSCRGLQGATCGTNFDCILGHCVDNYCCSSLCAYACDACNAGDLGWPGGVNGSCATAPMTVRYPGRPACTPYVCNGTSPSCSVFCSSDAGCATGYYCSGMQCIRQT